MPVRTFSLCRRQAVASSTPRGYEALNADANCREVAAVSFNPVRPCFCSN